MNHLLRLLAIALMGLIFFSFATPKEGSQTDRLNLLVFTKTEGDRHANIPEGIKRLRMLSDQENWNMTATEDASFFTDSYLSKVDVVVFFNTSGDILNEAEETALEAYINNGGGFVGIHAAVETEPDWPFYQALIAAQATIHTSPQEARLTAHQETHHPAINHLNHTWTLTDEWYEFKEPISSDAMVLLEVEKGTIAGQTPIAWAHQKFGGRTIYTGIGHTAAQFADPMYLAHLTRSIQWAGGQYEIDQPNTWQNLLDDDLTHWDTYIGVPHESVTLPFEFPKQANITKGKALGLDRDPLQVFSVQEGEKGEPVLYITGEIYGAITSKVNYQDYHFSCEFKWGEKKWEPRLERRRDNGLLFHGTGKHGAFWNVWMRSLECQIQEEDFGDFYPLAGTIANFPVRNNPSPDVSAFVYDPNGVEVAAAFLPRFTAGRIVRSQNYEKPNGEWNTVEIMTIGGKAVFIVNGQLVSALTKARYQEGDLEILLRGGKIQIQSEGAEAYYKNIQIKGIDAFPKEIMEAAGWQE